MSDIAYKFAIDNRDRVPSQYVDGKLRAKIAPALFDALLGAGPVVVDLQASVDLEPWRDQTVHGVRASLTAVSSRRVEMMSIDDLRPPRRKKKKPKPEPVGRRVLAWLKAEWDRTATDPGVEYDGP